ncbi:DegT/DnrJ/EryC1/StrS family aminotransferase [Agriterribacter sp.]|uniref:DegT/DnrJ/EryC1/StrS family aminotransferase n=1 Tax=Agriterribacter sp. TaxID=2821509 RepID=UPI002C8F1056|nr:DegT/DnrJ/EryC1/StrS family aminotransferase [Agriterribacter sp.]HTN06098.1 DegT/DnrJ/EryC1/StrS family aminotransferase [Agriterribacter sp.]
MINVTKPFLPPFDEYQQYLKGIWDRAWLTNNGPLVNELELKLKEYLQVPHLLFLANGTIALQIAIKALELNGEIITTPFSFVATTSSIVWEGCKPIFVDIDPGSLNIDPQKIEASITNQTTAILATHVYGNPCDIDAIQHIADKHTLKVIYDAAHCFGTTYKGKSVFAYGDVSTTSFHATKLFHTIEGGAVFTMNADLLKKMSFLGNFGYNGPEDFEEAGINAKNSEFHAAMGLSNLKYISNILESRRAQSLRYDHWLKESGLASIAINPESNFNYAYYPILFSDEKTTLKIIKELDGNKIKPRRYFYPSLNTIEIYKSGVLPVSEEMSKRVLCLPLYHTLSMEEIDFICRIILRVMAY